MSDSPVACDVVPTFGPNLIAVVLFNTHVCLFLVYLNSVFDVIVIHSFGILIGACVIFKQLFSSK